MAHLNRVVILVDMDCFYCQVEEKLEPSLAGKPIAVVQYNAWKGGGIIAVNYPARDKGVTRHMRGDEAKAKCPEIELVRVPQVRGKADLSKYREAGKQVADVLQTFSPLLERASVDEAYLDITELVRSRLSENRDDIRLEQVQNTYIVGCKTSDFLANVYANMDLNESNLNLAMGGLIAEEVRAAIYNVTGYRCSAGIAHNKILAKLVCGINKPNKQTILPHEAVPELFATLPIRKIKSLGGKFGNTLTEVLRIANVGELVRFSENELAKHFDKKTANWLYNIARGIDNEPVTIRLISKSIGCCKNFMGKATLRTEESIAHWTNELAIEIAERLEKDADENNRRAKTMIVTFAQNGVSNSRTVSLNSYERAKIAQSAVETIRKYCKRADGSYLINHLGISVGNFEEVKKNVREITSFFSKGCKSEAIAGTSKQQDFDYSCEQDSTDSVVNSSVFSATTEEDLDQIGDETVYFDEVFPEKCVEKKPEDYSFFANYFQKKKEEDERVKEEQAKLQQEEAPVEENGEEEEIINEEPEVEVNPYEIQSSGEDLFQTCPECKKKILAVDYFEHLDYHYALKMVREEAHLYKNIRPPPSEVKQQPASAKKSTKELSKDRKVEVNKGIKRKSKDSGGKEPLKSITSFWNKNQAEDLNDQNSEFCGECRKRIKLEEIVDHSDYHAAKRLHAELNSSERVAVNATNGSVKKKVGNSSKVKDKKKLQANSIATFFKA